MAKQQPPLLKFGAIADVQYADVDDGTNFAQTRKRYYRAALDSLKRAVAAWKASQPALAFVLQLGDLIDGLNGRVLGAEASKIALQRTVAPFKNLPCPTYHMVGNHDLYNMTRSQCLQSELNSGRLPSAQGVEEALYYAVNAHRGLKILVLDTYDVSVLGYKDNTDHGHYRQAEAILEKHNPNPEKNSSVGLKREEKRFAAFNGGLGEKQLAWLDAQLTDADSNSQNVLICGHVQLAPSVNCDQETSTCLVWNYREVLGLLHSHKCVVACLSGHDHDGTYAVDGAGIPHLVLNGVVEVPPGIDAYATLSLHPASLELTGTGPLPSRSFPLKYCANTGAKLTDR